MRVLLSLRSDALKVFGGDTLYAQEIAKALHTAGVEVVVSEKDQSLRDVDGLGQVDLVNVINVVNLEEAVATVDRAKAAKIPVIITPEYYNLDRFFLHTHWKANLARMVVGERAGLALYSMKKQLSSSWKKLVGLMQQVDHTIAKSEREKRQLILDFSLPPERISVVKNGIDPGFAAGASPEKFIKRHGVKDFILTVGRVEPIKNQLSLLKATQGLDVPIVFVGGGYTASDEYLLECRRVARNRPVHFIDRLPHGELAHAFAAAKAHVAPSYNETTSLVSMEAVLADCPIVLTRESPYDEYFGQDVITCDPYDLRSIRSSVEKVLDYPSETKRLRERLIKCLSWTKIGEELSEVYRRVVA